MQASHSQSSNGASNSAGLHNLGTLLKRLEAATSRLEDIALAQHAEQQLAPTLPGQSALQQQPTASQAGAAQSVGAPAAGPGGSSQVNTLSAPGDAAKESSPAVQAYMELIDGPLKTFVDLSNAQGGDVAEQAQHVHSAFTAQLLFVTAASECKKIPTSDPSYLTLLKPTQESLMAVGAIKDKKRPRDSKEHNSVIQVAEGIPALAWVTLDAKPAAFVGDMKDSATFYTNRVIKEFKDSDPKKIEWARSFITLLDQLQAYVKTHHTTGLSWNPTGQDVSAYLASTGPSPAGGAPSAPPAPPAPSAGGAPPPPPPAPTGSSAAPSAAKSTSSGGDMSAVFGALQKGGEVTKGLRKVDQSQMTHKNPELRTSSAVPAREDKTSPSRPSVPRKPESFKKKAPPRKELDGNKWMIENFENDREIVIDDTGLSQTVNIFGCKDSVIQIKGKVNAISMVSCRKTSVLLDSTVSALSVTGSPSFTVQILGKVPTILIDSTDGGQIYLSQESLDVELITSKTSGLNVSVPKPREKDQDYDEYTELPIPEQMKTVVAGNKLKTEIVEHSG